MRIGCGNCAQPGVIAFVVLETHIKVARGVSINSGEVQKRITDAYRANASTVGVANSHELVGQEQVRNRR